MKGAAPTSSPDQADPTMTLSSNILGIPKYWIGIISIVLVIALWVESSFLTKVSFFVCVLYASS